MSHLLMRVLNFHWFCRFIYSKAEPEVSHIQKLVDTLLDIVLSCHDDLAVQARWGGLLHRLLRAHSRKLSLVVPWRPLYEMLRAQSMEPSATYEGEGQRSSLTSFSPFLHASPLFSIASFQNKIVPLNKFLTGSFWNAEQLVSRRSSHLACPKILSHLTACVAIHAGAGVMEARRSSLVHILHRARRFFPLGSAAEIWAEFAPPLQDPSSPAAFEAVGWLCMLMPTQEALRQQGNWAEWVPQWVSLLNSVTHNQYIESLWLSLFARLIKHDVHGMVYWPAVLPELWARMLWAFQLPVGTATASPPYYGSAPSLCAALFTDELGSRSASAAKAVIYLVGRQPVGADGEDPALVELESAVALLEQYYHPSNGGKWTAGLAIFLRELTAHLCRRLVAEHYVSVDASAVPQDSDEESDEDDGDGEDSESDDGGGVDSSSTDDEVATVPAGGAAAAPAARRHLTPPTRRRLVSAIVRLASKGQSSKDRSLRRASSASLALLANVEPDLVLPIVHRHFATALDTVTAARQYGGAIQTLSLCARPLLLAGLQPESAALLEEGGGSGGGADVGMALSRSEARAAAAQSLASAMMSTLPGIDANDPPKSLAVFRLYCCILSCVGDLPVRSFGFAWGLGGV